MSNWVRADDVKKAIDNLPHRVVHDYGEYVSKELYEQMVGERDIAISQLEDLGIAFGQNPRLVAIPIEWLREWFKERYKSKTYEHLIEDWEKQNESSICN